MQRQEVYAVITGGRSTAKTDEVVAGRVFVDRDATGNAIGVEVVGAAEVFVGGRPEIGHKMAVETAADGRRTTRFEEHNGRVVRIVYEDVTDKVTGAVDP